MTGALDAAERFCEDEFEFLSVYIGELVNLWNPEVYCRGLCGERCADKKQQGEK